MKFFITFAIVCSLIVFVSCQDTDNYTTNSILKVEGYWGRATYEDSICIYGRTDSLIEQEYGFAILASGSFIERKDAYWCSVPPSLLADFEGTWIINDSILNIMVPYWGGSADYTWRILSVDNEKLRIYKVNECYRENVDI